MNTENELGVTISKADKQWGQYVRVTLRYRGPLSLQNINLESWHQFAAITYGDETSGEDEKGRPVQIVQLRLHPRSTGSHLLPALQLGDASSQPVTINISDPVVKNHAIKLHFQISGQSPWQRQAVTIRVSLQTSDFSAHVRIDPVQQQGVIAETLKPVRQELADGMFRFDTGWTIYPVSAGLLSLDLPPVKYQLSGSDRRKFYLPLLQMDVKTLPAYLPPTLPVGQLSVSSQIKTSADSAKQWQIKIQTDGLIPYGVPGLDAQLAALSQRDIAEVKTSHSQLSADQNLSIYHAPLPDWMMSHGKDVALKLRYFDPETGRQEEINHLLPRQWQMPSWAWWIALFLILSISALFFWRIAPWVQSYYYRLKLRHQLKTAASAQDLRRLILNHGHCVTLSQWAEQDKKREPIIHELNRSCFAVSTHTDIQILKASLLRSM